MKALITGAGGQLGRALQAAAPADVEFRGVSHAECDVADRAAVTRTLQEVRPALLINAAGFTRVDDAETQPAAAERANGLGPAVLAACCREAGTWLLHVSTDYVFDGGQGHPYAADAAPNPLGVYGQTKRAGEVAVATALPAGSTIVRTSWVYGALGRNFLTTMLALMNTRSELRVVADQVGAPTHSDGLARTLWDLAQHRAPGYFHWCDSGVASWYDFATAIAEEALPLKLIAGAPTIVPIRSAQYPTAARRPPFSLLDKQRTEEVLGRMAPHWRAALRTVLRTLPPSTAPGAAR
jgi:dTDP-4-dehydrorhamnose reductase